MVNKKSSDSSPDKFNHRGQEDVYYDVLLAISELQHINPTLTKPLTSKVHGLRHRKPNKQFKEIHGALLRNVMDRCKMNNKMCKRYLLEMYEKGLIDLGIYIGNVNKDYSMYKSHPKLDRLITLTDKGYKLLKLLGDMREMLNFDIKTSRGVMNQYGYTR